MKTAIEFYSGIGAFSEAVRDLPVRVLAAFDQCPEAGDVYRHNFSLRPSLRNLDTIRSGEIPDADIWWMSPPCTPFTVRGNRSDIGDPRAASFLNLMRCIPAKRPRMIYIENVLGFENSKVHNHLRHTLKGSGYAIQEFRLCPTDFGIPMRRPRFFITASIDRRLVIHHHPHAQPMTPLSEFLVDDDDSNLRLEPAIVARYGESLNILEPDDSTAIAICFTRNYWKSMKSPGSFLRTQAGAVRRFSPREILNLLGFSPKFSFSDSVSNRSRWRLTGNSVDVRCVRHLLDTPSAGIG